jgi:PAS domain S-box-containing protein
LLSEGQDLSALDLEPGEVVGESVFERYADSPEVIDAVRRALNGEQVETELEVDGRIFDNWYSPFYDDSGTVAGCIGMSVDVTERKRVKAELRESEERLQVAQRIANLGYWTYDLETGELVWSDETRRIFGWPDAEEVTYEAFMEAVHPDDRERLREAKEAARAGEARLDVEYRIRRPSGEERVVQERGGLQRDEDGEPVSIMGAVLDVTERVRRREQLEAAKEAAEEADRIKTALLSNMNHELRTPLTSIISFSELISDNPAIAERFVSRILGGAHRLLYTLNTVMDFAELEGETGSITPHAFQLREVIRSVANDFRKKARRKGLALSVDVPDGLGSVRLDEHRIERILTHLVHNAVKFTDAGSVTIAARVDGDTLELEVSDTGKGIDPEFLPQVFDEFAQASSGYDRTHEGNGLGLTVARRFVEQMNGTIDVESEPGKGTCVTVSLPPSPDASSVPSRDNPPGRDVG